MRTNADRTLVKSQAELWELVDDPDLMREWCAYLTGSPAPVPVEITAREDGASLAWRSSSGTPSAAVELRLLEKGFGTKVTITATCDGAVPGDTLESLLDELGSPQRRPFTRG